MAVPALTSLKKIHKILLAIAKEIDIMKQHIISRFEMDLTEGSFEMDYESSVDSVLGHARDSFFPSSFADSLSSSKLNAYHKNKFLSVGLEEPLKQLRKDLTGSSHKLEKVGIVGMSGIGKTTLANLIFQDPSVIQHFDLLVWIKISQSHSKTDMLLQVLNDIRGQTEASLEEAIYRSLTSQGNLINQQINDIHGQTEASLEEDISRSLKGQRYLIVVDDLWNDHSWDEMRSSYPDDSMGSRILFTGQEGNEIEDLGCQKIHQMSLLNEDTSWDLLQKRVFGQDACPPGLVDTGKQIAKKCQGLPLAIDVISGVLLKISNTMESWKVIAETISSLVLSSTNPCQEIFALSYKHLPSYLKSCFLYMGAFPRGGFEIESKTLVRLWIAEGFITPSESENLEQVADGYLKDLIDRSLVLTASKRSNGDVKTCRMHDLLLEFCIKQAREDKFLNVNLRHVQFQVANYLPPPNDELSVEQIVSLQTLSKVSLSSCSTLESFGRLPNVTKLRVCETREDFHADYQWNRFFKNLVLLKHLEILKVYCMQMNIYSPRTLPIPSPNAFPESLRKLTLSRSHLRWEKIKILSELPNLEVLKLKNYAFKGAELKTKRGGFQRLNYLLIENTDLRNWSLEGDDCFPRLQQLVLKFCHLLEEVPEDIGNTPSLSSMELRFCSSAAEQSVKYIQEVQEEYGHNIQVLIQRKIVRN